MNSTTPEEAVPEPEASSTSGTNGKYEFLDPNCMVNLTQKLVRIQYPGVVKNVDKAIETLGGMYNIEKVVSNHKNNLDLRFHPQNKYNKPCSGDKDYHAGILLKVKAKLPMKGSTEKPSYDYSIVGVTAQNITFNRLCDFQYLPLIPKSEPETKESEVENIYRKILPETIPTLDYFKSKESEDMPFYFTPAAYGRFDTSNNKLFLETGERYESDYRPEIASSVCSKVKSDSQTIAKPFARKHHFAYTINYTGGKVPETAPTYILQVVKERFLTDEYQKVSKLFDERPIWTRAAIMYTSKMSFEHSKIILPAVAYYVRRGPWRSTWIKFGYDPRSDPKSRSYQTLDYRIRTSEGSKHKIGLKRKPVSKSVDYVGPLNLQKVSLAEETVQKAKAEVSENCFMLTPTTLPPARQLFYQYCDLKLPELEKMLARLPQPSPNTNCHPKNGWLPAKFTEQCREVVNKYILETIRREMMEEQETSKEQDNGSKMESEPGPSTSSEYCSRMLSNIRKGIYTTIPISTTVCHMPADDTGDTPDAREGSSSVKDNDEKMFETAQEHIERTIPERLNENLLDDDDGSSQSSDDLDIDMEALEEVNQMIGVPKKKD